jgi:rhamnose transport system substrate-binding protein
VSAAASATNQNAWIGYMKQQLKKYPKMKLVSIVYGNDDPTTATQVTQGLLQHYPNLTGIISPTTVGILAAAQVVDSSKYKGKVMVTGLGTPNSMKKYVADGTVPAFERPGRCPARGSPAPGLRDRAGHRGRRRGADQGLLR